ncbi:MAG: N-acetylmuramoyl-L-alanine amidase [Sphingobacteriia bacterium]|nr:N-acetylmuramoyl-L-alanine amidase [Sphingobacteriia bacterium]
MHVDIDHSYPSQNFSNRNNDQIDTIILHYTVTNFEKSLSLLTQPEFKVSSHYLIREDGKIFNLVDPNKKAFHAGMSFWRGKDNLNENSIGIEIVNNGNAPFTNAQVNSVIALCLHLKQLFPLIKDQNIIGHSDIAIGRKLDPGKFFPWEKLAETGIGLWTNLKFTSTDFEILYRLGHKDSEIYRLKELLKHVGYKVNNLNNEFDLELKMAIYAFQLHFNPTQANGEFNQATVKLATALNNYI